MKNLVMLMLLALLVGVILPVDLQAQGILRKVKERVEDKALDKVFDKDKPESERPSQRQERTDGAGRPAHRGGEGITASAPDVNANIRDAQGAFDSKKYGEARFAIRQAILGVEMEIGAAILKDLPESISNLPKLEELDRVTSSGIGFVGLMIERTYRSSDKELKLTIGNDSGLLTAANMYLMSGAYGTTSTDQTHKTVRVNEYRGVLEYDEYSGYKLSVPFGQSSVMVLEGINIQTENEMIAAAEKIDLDNIKKTLGEQ
jgi:hypothetical protein